MTVTEEAADPIRREIGTAMRIAVVTGASCGLGRQFVRRIAEKEKDIDEIWVLARTKEKLEALQNEVPVRIRPFPCDLTDPESIRKIAERFREEKPVIGILINAAGFGKIGNYEEVSREDDGRMIELNCRAAVDMTMISLPYMKKGSRILEICSTAAFQPFQFLSVYAATKAFLYRYSRALRVELFPRGIKVTAVCPYWIKDTDFIPTAEETEQTKRRIRHYPLATHASLVAAVALRDSRLGFAVSVPGIMCFLHRIVAKVIPHELMMGVWALLRRA